TIFILAPSRRQSATRASNRFRSIGGLARQEGALQAHGFGCENLVGEGAPASKGESMSRIVYVNGEYVPEEQGNVSIFDSGFRLADGVYEGTAVAHGRLIDYAPHMERRPRALAETSMAWPCSRAELRRMHEELISRNRLDQGWVYMQVTRGAAD